MRTSFPPVPGTIGQGFITQLVSQLTQLFARVVATDQAVPRVILRSPDGTSWDVTVDNTGALKTTKNTGKINAAGGHPP